MSLDWVKLGSDEAVPKAGERRFGMSGRKTPGVDAEGLFSALLDAPPMEAKSAEALPTEPGEWQFEPKWDGFRCLAFKRGGAVELKGKSGTSLARFFPEVVATLVERPGRAVCRRWRAGYRAERTLELRRVASEASPCGEPNPPSGVRNTGSAHSVRHADGAGWRATRRSSAH